jgi:hypothetical protein
MRHHHQMFTVFGGSFVPESRETTRPPAPRRKDRAFAPLAMLLVAGLLGATIPAVAYTTANRIRAAEAARWQQPQSTLFWHGPATIGIEQALY